MPTIAADPAQAARAHRMHDTSIEELRPWRAGGAHLNFISPSGVADGEVRESYHAAEYARLQQLKQTWDPRNMFRLNRNIPPAELG